MVELLCINDEGNKITESRRQSPFDTQADHKLVNCNMVYFYIEFMRAT